MIHMTAERGESKSNGVRHPHARCSIYDQNRAEKVVLAPTPYPESNRGNLNRVWGLNGVKTGSLYATRAMQTHGIRLPHPHSTGLYA